VTLAVMLKGKSGDSGQTAEIRDNLPAVFLKAHLDLTPKDREKFPVAFQKETVPSFL
jgi:hypothetical protein